MQVYTSATHWGVFTARVHGGDIAAVAALASDTNPAPQLQNLPGAVRHRSRIANPAVRRGWLQHGPGPSSARGAEEFVEVSWDELIELLASELRRTVDRYGNEAIYGSSYGWASAGRFHHAQSQVHRFLNMVGGYTASRHSYSAGASEVIFPHIVGAALFEALAETTTWDVIVDHTALLVAFGGLPVKNTAVMPGGTTAHPDRDYVGRYRARGGRLVSVSPLRDDIAAIAGPLALAHAKHAEGDRVAAFWAQAMRLRDLLKFDFYFADSTAFRANIAQEMAWHQDWEDHLGVGGNEIDAMLYAKRPLMSDAMLRVFFEAYEIVADVLRDAPPDIGPEELTELALGLGRQFVAQGRVRSSEPVSTLLFATARQVAVDQELIAPAADLAERRVAFRRELRNILRDFDYVEQIARNQFVAREFKARQGRDRI